MRLSRSDISSKAIEASILYIRKGALIECHEIIANSFEYVEWNFEPMKILSAFLSKAQIFINNENLLFSSYIYIHQIIIIAYFTLFEIERDMHDKSFNILTHLLVSLLKKYTDPFSSSTYTWFKLEEIWINGKLDEGGSITCHDSPHGFRLFMLARKSICPWRVSMHSEPFGEHEQTEAWVFFSNCISFHLVPSGFS